jgi:hypothetical protein
MFPLALEYSAIFSFSHLSIEMWLAAGIRITVPERITEDTISLTIIIVAGEKQD